MNIPQVMGSPLKLPARASSPRRAQDYITIILFLLPAVVLFILFLVYPIIRSAYYSLYNWNGMGPATLFVGLKNFQQILTDPVFLKAVGNCFLIVVLSLVVQLPLALVLCPCRLSRLAHRKGRQGMESAMYQGVTINEDEKSFLQAVLSRVTPYSTILASEPTTC